MQHDVDNSIPFIEGWLSYEGESIVAEIPKKVKDIKELRDKNQMIIDECKQTSDTVRESLAYKVSSLDIDIVTKIVLAASGEMRKKEEAQKIVDQIDKVLLVRKVVRQINKEEDAERTGVTEIEVTHAREYPIKNLVKMQQRNTLCLWHNDKHPSMYVYPDNHAFCFSCKKRADSIDFVQKMNGLDFVSAVRYLTKV